jgi:hypothetical protein
MENTTIIIILIIVIIFLYLNSKSNKVEQYSNVPNCLMEQEKGSCKENPEWMKINCPDFCNDEYGEYYGVLEKLFLDEKKLLKERQDLINSGQDPTKKNLELQNIYNQAMDLKNRFRVVDNDFNIKIDPNTNKELKSRLESILYKLQNRRSKIPN